MLVFTKQFFLCAMSKRLEKQAKTFVKSLVKQNRNSSDVQRRDAPTCYHFYFT